MRIAVIGGGLTGLSSSFYLSRRFPSAVVSLYERGERFGGWVRSERVQDVLLEYGPRTLRPQAKSVLELVNYLNLENSLVTTKKSSPAAKYRFIRVQGKPGLVPIPSSISPSLLSSPFTPILLQAIFRALFRTNRRTANEDDDESVDSFLTRRFGEPFARTFGSALVHGIYAADSRMLSVRAAFPALWEAELRGEGNVLRGFFRHRAKQDDDDDKGYVLGDVASRMKDVSVFSFRDGIETITNALRLYLQARPNVRLYPGVCISSLRVKDADNRTFELKSTHGDTLNPTHVVSAIPLPTLHSLLHSSAPLPHLTANPASSVTVMNLVFPPTPQPIHPPGFGYLVPRPPTDYDIREPGILGTVFDSCAASSDGDDANALQKLTVMIGGPHPLTPAHTALPTVLKHIASHLSPRPVDLPEPILTRVHNHKDCIPTLTVGHLLRMKELSAALAGEPWGGRLEVVGAGVGGVSVGDCVQAGRHVGMKWT